MEIATTADLSLERLSEKTTPALERFLEATPEATFFYSPTWHRIIEATYGHQCDYWIARTDEDVLGVFPVVTMRYPVLGAKMVAMPYQLHSGIPLAAHEAIQLQLVERAVAYAEEQGVKYLEIRHYDRAPFLEEAGFQSMDSHLVTTTVPLEDLTLKSIRRNHRRNIRDARKDGLTVREGKTLDDLRTFRHLYQVESRAMGAPQAGWVFYENLHRLAVANYHVYLAEIEGRVIGGLLTLEDDTTVFARYAAYSSPEALRYNAGKVLYWRALQDAAGRGCRYYNCGISWVQDTGLISWKEGWNGTSNPVHLYVYPIRSEPPAPGNYFEGFQLAKTIWRRLPLPVADWLGQRVTHWVG